MIKISFLGDIICQMPFLKAAQSRNNDFYTAFSKLDSLLKDSDYVVGNLETPIAGSESGYSEEIYSFNTPDSFLDALKKVKIDLYQTANNHCLDRGIEGLKNTLIELEKRQMAHTGTSISKDEPKFFVKNIGDVKIAFFSYTDCVNSSKWEKYGKQLTDYNLNLMIDIDKYFTYREAYKARTIPLYHIRKKLSGMVSRNFEFKVKNLLGIKLRPMIDNEPLDEVCGQYLDTVEEEIKKAKVGADLVIFLPHCGGQFNKNPGKLSQALFQKLFELNVDAIIASHPHTIQKCGLFNDKPYAFSLGNVSPSPSYPFFIKEAKSEYGMIFHIYIDNKKIVKSSFSLIKSVEQDDHYPIVWPIDELYAASDDSNKASLEQDIKVIFNRIFDDARKDYSIQKEYGV